MSESTFIEHDKCQQCGSKNNLAIYTDHEYCFGCGYYYSYKEDQQKLTKTVSDKNLKLEPLGERFHALGDRNIAEETAKKYGVYLGEKGYLFPYYSKDGKQYIAGKHRKRVDKEFWSTGAIQQSGLFGQQLFPPGSGKYVTVTEGEFDCLSVSEMLGNRYPVVSLKNGASGAVKDCQDNYEYLNSFETIVLCFDKDEAHVNSKGEVYYPGQDAAIAVADLFAKNISKIKILTLKHFKDGNEYLSKGKIKEFINEWWQAPAYTPSGLRIGKDMWDEIITPRKFESVPYPWQVLNSQTYGIRLSEFVLITGDPGGGKTTILKEVAFPLITEHKAKVGFLFFEEPNYDTLLGLMSIGCNKPLHLPDVREHISDKELRNVFDDTVGNDRVVLWDHFGSNSIHEVLAKIHHMAALGCKYIVLDHLSIIVSDQSGDERKQLDEISTKLKTITMETNIGVIAAIHQSRSGVIRGSAGPEQLANIVIKLYRDKEEIDPWRRNVTKLVVEKNRFSGRTGPSSYLFYDPISGRLNELDEEQIKRYEEGKE